MSFKRPSQVILLESMEIGGEACLKSWISYLSFASLT